MVIGQLVLGSCFATPLFAAEVFIPTHLAQTRDRAEGTNGKTIVIVEEAHVDYAAQKAIANILQDLVENESLTDVFVEGGWEDVSLTPLRRLTDPERRKEVAEEYLRQGKISGDEYLSLATDLDLRLWGVEDPKLYEANMKVFLEFSVVRPKLLNELKELDLQIQSLQTKVLTPAMIEIAAKRRGFEDQTVSLLDYAQSLTRHLPDAAKSFPHLSSLVSLSGQDGTYDPDKLAVEKKSVMRFLSQRLTKPELEDILALEGQKTTEGELAFLETLLKKTRELSRIRPFPAPKNLIRYRNILRKIARMDTAAIFPELEEAVQAAFLAEKPSPEQAAFLGIVRGAAMLGKLFDLSLTENEFGALSSGFEEISKTPSLRAERSNLKDRHAPVRPRTDSSDALWRTGLAMTVELDHNNRELETWDNFLTKISATHGMTYRSFDVKEFLKWIPMALSFYRTARAREKAMIENLDREIKARDLNRAALIAGGFHSRNIFDALKKRGYTVVLVSPRFAPSEDRTQHEHYLEVLKSKWTGTDANNLKAGMEVTQIPKAHS